MSSPFDFALCGWEIDPDRKKHKEDDGKKNFAAKPKGLFLHPVLFWVLKEKTLNLTKKKVVWFTRLNAVAQTVI